MIDDRSLPEILADCESRFVNGKLSLPEPKPQHVADQQLVTPDVGNRTIPKRFRGLTLDSTDLRTRMRNPRAIMEARAVMSTGDGILFAGPTGCGKTSLACALLRAWEASAPNRHGVFMPAFRLLTTSPAELERAKDAALLVLDELGGDRPSFQNAVTDVLYERHYSALPTWVTTWMNAEDVANRYGGGIARRLFEEGLAVKIDCSPVSYQDRRGGTDS